MLEAPGVRNVAAAAVAAARGEHRPALCRGPARRAGKTVRARQRTGGRAGAEGGRTHGCVWNMRNGGERNEGGVKGSMAASDGEQRQT